MYNEMNYRYMLACSARTLSGGKEVISATSSTESPRFSILSAMSFKVFFLVVLAAFIVAFLVASFTFSLAIFSPIS